MAYINLRPHLLVLMLMTIPCPPSHALDSHPVNDHTLTDFTNASSDLGWYIVNDTVMGGRSNGQFKLQEGQLTFTGSTNTRGGGFSSIRTKPVKADLSNFDGIRLHLKGDGRRYTWRLTTNARWRGRQVSYWADFDTRDDTWSKVSIPFSDFIPRFRGYVLDGPALNPAAITGMGLMIYDKQDGPFELQLTSVLAYGSGTHFTLDQFRWKNRVVVVNAPHATDGQLENLRNEVKQTRNEFSDRNMVLVILLDDAVSTADNRDLKPEKVATIRTTLKIKHGSFTLKLLGKDGSVKLTKAKFNSMTEIYELIDSMPMRQLEQTTRQPRPN